jgi:FixJ family two-component response regulator
VDDDAAVLASLKFALEMEGLFVEAYQDPADLLMRAEPQNTNCLILDYNLPGTNGLDLLGALRKKGVAAPAIIITSNPGPWLRQRAASEGVLIVEKPLLGNTLLDAIHASLGGRSH